MGVTDILLMIPIAGGALYVLYRSLWKKKGQCSGCEGGCGTKAKDKSKGCCG